jgi:hypothetical protein
VIPAPGHRSSVKLDLSATKSWGHAPTDPVDAESEKTMFYQNNAGGQAAILGALNNWYLGAPVLFNGAWFQLHPAGRLLYNCGGVNNGGDYGRDYVDNALYQWLTNHLPAGWAFAGGPTTVWGGAIGANGQPQFTRDYYTITQPLPGQVPIGNGFPGIPAGTYTVVVNFHLYVDAWQVNPTWIAPPPPPPPAPPPLPLNINDLAQFPPLG